MESIFAFIFSFPGELLLQVIAEALAELGLHSMRDTLRQPANPWFAALGYALFVIIAGGLSLLLFPHLFVHVRALQIINVVLTPLAAGLAMMAWGAWRRRRAQPRSALTSSPAVTCLRWRWHWCDSSSAGDAWQRIEV